MAGTKRPLPEEATQSDTVHPARKRRLEVDDRFSKIFNDLREDISATRLDAAKDLVNLLAETPDRLDNAITRLVKGLCSNAKAARLGFSIALVEVLRAAFASGKLKLADVTQKIISLTSPEAKASGDERRSHWTGRKFASHAVLESGVLEKADSNDAKLLFDAVADLATQKDWIRNECGLMLYTFVRGQQATQLSNETVRALIDSWVDKGLLKSPEGVALWLTIKKSFSEAKLPKGHWHHSNPLSSQERPTLTKILLKNAVDDDEETNGAVKKKKSGGARQVRPSFAWETIIGHLYREDDGKKFAAFWEECVASAMFSPSSSTERKSLGLQIFSDALSTAPCSLLKSVVHSNILRCIVDQRAKSDRFLFEASKVPLNQMANRAKSEPAAASEIACKLLTVMPSFIDKTTKATIETIFAAADLNGLGDIVAAAVSICRTPGIEDASDAEKKRRLVADLLLSLVRTRRSEPSTFSTESGLQQWLELLLRDLTHLGFTTRTEKIHPPLMASTRTVFRERLMSILSHLVDLPLQQASQAPSFVTETLHDSKKILDPKLDTDSMTLLKEGRKNLKAAAKKAEYTNGSEATVAQAFQLLLALGMLQVYKQETDSSGVLEDIIACYQNPEDTGDAATMLVELLLSFVSKQSALFRKLAEQVFSAFAPDVTAEALQSMTDILSQKESLAGQQELFDNQDEEEGDAPSGADDDSDGADGIDVEDASDVEIVNGNVIGNGDDDESEADNSEEDVEPSDDDEAAAFDRKLADALGTAGMDEDEDEDGSDMDDEQMMALEPHLTTIFKERKKGANKKQENKDAKENIVNFKNRVLDLLDVYVKSQYANPIAMDLIHPLVVLARTTSSQVTAKKALEVLERYYDTGKKHKKYPQVDHEAVFEVLSAVHADMKLGGSKLHATACSRSSLFLAKLLVSEDPAHWKQINSMYGELQFEWRENSKSKIHGSIFNDWHNWSMQRASA